MRTTLQAEGCLLTANADERTLTYRLLPFGEQGRTSMGLVTASKGSLTLPEKAESLVANMEHDRTRPVARATAVSEDDDGITATFRIARTAAGNDLLVEAAEGLRTGISVEISDPTIRDGALTAGLLDGAGFVTAPAFPSAQLVASDTEPTEPVEKAVDMGDEFEMGGVTYRRVGEDVTEADEETDVVINDVIYRRVEDDEPETIEPPEADAAEDPDTEDDESEETEKETDVTASTAATAPAGLRATAAGGGNKLLTASSHPQDLFALLAKAGQTKDKQLIAALSDITNTGAISNTTVPQYVGEMWEGKATQRRIVPLFNHAPLTSDRINGWRWLVKPVVAPYTGNKAAVPSNAATTEPVTLPAERIAGAHDIDRKYKDFGDQGFWQSYVAAMIESYAVVSDAQVMADVLAEATPVVAGAPPTDVTDVWNKIVTGALSVLQATNAMPSFAVVAFDLYKQFLLTPQEGGLEYLNAALGLDGGTASGFTIVPHASLAAGSVLAGAKEAVTVHELSTVPIRVEAENIGNGGIDVGVFGYYATNVHDPEGLALVTTA